MGQIKCRMFSRIPAEYIYHIFPFCDSDTQVKLSSIISVIRSGSGVVADTKQVFSVDVACVWFSFTIQHVVDTL